MDNNKNKGKFFKYIIYWTPIKLARSNYVFRILVDVLAYIFYTLYRKNKTFYFQGTRFPYFYHPYNRTVASERIVEIPLAKSILDYYKQQGKKILEVGNVLAHYFPVNHDVLDKYEKAPGVINEDVQDVKFQKKYDLIISISTMEHVGWTYGEKKDPGKFLRGIANLKKHLAKNGTMMVTFPLFYRGDLSKLIINRKMPFIHEYFMKRVSFLNEWGEVNLGKAIKGAAYDTYFANANILYIGFYSRSKPIFASGKLKLKSPKLNFLHRIQGSYRLVKAFFEDL